MGVRIMIRRISRQIESTRNDAEVALVRLKVAQEERRVPARPSSEIGDGFGIEHAVNESHATGAARRHHIESAWSNRLVAAA